MEGGQSMEDGGRTRELRTYAPCKVQASESGGMGVRLRVSRLPTPDCRLSTQLAIVNCQVSSSYQVSIVDNINT